MAAWFGCRGAASFLEPDRPAPESPPGFNGVLALPTVTTTKVTMSNEVGPPTTQIDRLAVNPSIRPRAWGRPGLGHAG